MHKIQNTNYGVSAILHTSSMLLSMHLNPAILTIKTNVKIHVNNIKFYFLILELNSSYDFHFSSVRMALSSKQVSW